RTVLRRESGSNLADLVDYTNLCRALNGEVIYISENSKSHLNPLEIVLTNDSDDDPVAGKYNFFLSFFETIMGKSGIAPEQKTIIDNCLHKIYNPILAGKTKEMPTLMDYFKVLGEFAKEKPEARSLYNSLELYATGSMSTFAHSSNVNTNNRVVVYDIKKLGNQLKSLGMMVVLENLWDRIVQNRSIGRRTRIYIDEIYLLFQNEQSANFLYELYKRARKWGGIPTGITQQIEDLLRSATGRSMLANSEFLLILSQSGPDREKLAELLKIPDESMGFVTNAIAGSGLMFAGSYGITPFKDDFPQNTELYKLMTTRFGEADNSEGKSDEGNTSRNTA
ncbi:MAG: conjugal transfer protein, partial [Eubacterium sp.]|nr:conjugal transfer protein [Eubacterium sp.]